VFIFSFSLHNYNSSHTRIGGLSSIEFFAWPLNGNLRKIGGPLCIAVWRGVCMYVFISVYFMVFTLFSKFILRFFIPVHITIFSYIYPRLLYMKVRILRYMFFLLLHMKTK